jgi:hypothetical protein
MANNEEKREAFLRLATKRTNALIDRIRVLGHCANRHQYEYDRDDVKRIFRAIDAELRAVKAKFQNSTQSRFTLE